MKTLKLINTIAALIVTILTFSSCNTNDKEVSLQLENKNVQIDTIISSSVDDKYVCVKGTLDGVKKSFIFDTIYQKLTQGESLDIIIKPKYDILYNNDGIIKVIDSSTQKQLYSINLVSEGIVKNNKVIEISKEISNTKRYLVVSQKTYGSQTAIINLESGSIVKLPLQGTYLVKWSFDDKKAIIQHILNFTGKKEDVVTYIWNIKDNSLDKVEVDSNLNLRWAKNNNYIYYVDVVELNKIMNYEVVRYNIMKKEWQKIYLTDKSIDDKTLRWISDSEIIFVASQVNCTNNPKEMLLKPRIYYIVRYNLNTKKEQFIPMDTVTLSNSAWSYDYKCLYYIGNSGFKRESIVFND